MVAAVVGQGPVVELGQFVAVEENLPAAGRVQPTDYVQQGRFAAARRSEQYNDLATEQVKIDPIQCIHRDIAGMVDLGHAACRYRAIRIHTA